MTHKTQSQTTLLVYPIRVSPWLSRGERGWSSLSVSRSPFSPFAKSTHSKQVPDSCTSHTVTRSKTDLHGFLLPEFGIRTQRCRQAVQEWGLKTGGGGGRTGGHLRGAKETEKAGFIRSKSRDEEWRMHSPRRSKREERGEREAPRGAGAGEGRGDSWLNYLVPLVFLLPAPGSGKTRVYLLTWGQAVSDGLVTPLPDFQKQLLFFVPNIPDQHSMVFNPCSVLALSYHMVVGNSRAQFPGWL